MKYPKWQNLEVSLDSMLEQIRESFDLPGFGVGVVKEGEVVYAKGYGVRDIQTQEPVTIRSLFHQASISKLFTTTAVMQLVEQDQIRLEDPVVRYLPQIRLINEDSESITIEQILSHTSGLPDPEDHDWAHPNNSENAHKSYLTRLSNLEMVTKPGKEFNYSSLGFNVLGALISEASGESFESYIKRHIFEPLEMDDSTFFRPDVPTDLAVSPHIRTPDLMLSRVFPYSRPQAPSGGLQSSVLDMSKWAMAILNRGLYNSRQNLALRILSAESIQSLWQPRAYTGQVSDLRQTDIGLGWFIGQYRNMPVVMHDGGDVGFETEIVLLPEQLIAVAVMANIFPAATTVITQAVLDIMIGPGVPTINTPLMLSTLITLRKSGLEAAVDWYQQADQESRDSDIAFLRDSIFILQEAHWQGGSSELLKLGARLFPGTKME